MLQNAAGLIVAHNHPSGSVEPSEEDLAVSRRLDAAGSIIGIDVLDHMIIGANGYASLKERGYFPSPDGQGQFLLNAPRPAARLRALSSSP